MKTASTSFDSMTRRQSAKVAGLSRAAAVAALSNRSGLMSHSASTFAFGCRITASSRNDPRLPTPIMPVPTGFSDWKAWAAKAEPNRKKRRFTLIFTSALLLYVHTLRKGTVRGGAAATCLGCETKDGGVKWKQLKRATSTLRSGSNGFWDAS